MVPGFSLPRPHEEVARLVAACLSEMGQLPAFDATDQEIVNALRLALQHVAVKCGRPLKERAAEWAPLAAARPAGAHARAPRGAELGACSDSLFMEGPQEAERGPEWVKDVLDQDSGQPR